MKRLNEIVSKYIFSEELPFNAKMNNIMGLGGIIAALITAIVHFFIGSDIRLVFFIVSIAILVAIMISLANKYNFHDTAIIVDLVFVGDICFPVIFFFGGGISGPTTAYFVLSIALVFLITKGKKLVIIITIHCIVILFCLYIGDVRPDLIVQAAPMNTYVNNFSAIFISGFLIGSIVLFQHKLYVDERSKVVSANAKLNKQDLLLHSVNEVATTLLTADHTNFSKAFEKSLEIITNGLNAERAILWKTEQVEGNNIYLHVSEWEKGDGLVFSEEFESKLFASGEFPKHWNDILSHGSHVLWNANTEDIQNKALLEPLGVKAMLIIPTYIEDTLWGAVGFFEKDEILEYSTKEIEMAYSASLIIASALNRDIMLRDLIVAREKALSATHAKTSFLSNMSHEMRTPMNAIIGMTAIGKASEEAEQKEYCLSKISEASTHLLGLINDILDMSKIEANKFELSFAEFDFERMLQRAVGIAKYRAEEKKQRLHVKIDNAIPNTLVGDDQRIMQVITNLLSNAVKFTPEGGDVSLTADLKKRVDNTCTIKVSVTDTGIGISEEQQEKLFQSFQQADSGTSRKFGGTGLGLAISKKIVEMMHGRIWIDSKLGEGATFTFEIDVIRAEKNIEKRLNEDVNWSNISVMVVDDDSEVRYILSNIAKSLEINYTAAADGEIALNILEKEHFDILFVDWKLPGMDGIELTRRIKAKEGKKSIVVMISANQWHDIEENAKAAGVDMFLGKPLFSSDIVDVINACLGIRGKKKQIVLDDLDGCFEGKRVLLAEDVEINREIVLSLLGKTKLQFDCAENGLEAVEMFSKNPEVYDLILMDVQMPEMDGLTAAIKIKELDIEKAKEIPIIAMTANVFKEDVDKYLASGMCAHLGKPIDFEMLVEILQKYLLEEE